MRLFLFLGFLFFVSSNIVNERVVRVLDLQSHVEKQIVKAEISNQGEEEIQEYYFPIARTKQSNIAYFKATDEKSNLLQVTQSETSPFTDRKGKHENYFFLVIQFSKPLQPKKKSQITLTLVFSHVLSHLPEKIKQKENAYVVYEGNRFTNSVYATKKQHTKVNVASEKIRSYTKDGFETLTGKKLKYGTYENVPAFASKPLKVHFRNNYPFLTMTSVVRDFEVSHWGNVRVSESYKIRNDGAKLVGAYESMDARMQYTGRLAEPTAVRDLKATLPARATRVTYTDRLGNITTSNFRRSRKKSTLEISLRYKLLGGWKTDFEIGYDVPAEDFIEVDDADSSLHYFNASFGIPFFKPVADHFVTRVALPEGAYDIQLDLPFGVDEQGNGPARFTYLDSSVGGGRPVVYFVKTNVVREHFDTFSIRYRYSRNRVFWKPLLVFFMFLSAFMVASLFSRLNLSISDGNAMRAMIRMLSDEITKKEELAELCERLQMKLNSVPEGVQEELQQVVTNIQTKISKKNPMNFGNELQKLRDAFDRANISLEKEKSE